MKTIVADIQYFPLVDFFSRLLSHDKLVIEAHEHYQKQTFRNRSHILTANGVQILVVPVLKSNSLAIKDIKIDYSQRWQQIHLRAIQAAYGKAPYFEHYIDAFSKTILSKPVFLFDMNVDILSICLKALKLDISLDFTSSFTKRQVECINDIRGIIIPQNKVPTEEERNSDSQYFQLFGSKFVNNLSVLDLVFNEGTNSKQILYKYSELFRY